MNTKFHKDRDEISLSNFTKIGFPSPYFLNNPSLSLSTRLRFICVIGLSPQGNRTVLPKGKNTINKQYAIYGTNRYSVTQSYTNHFWGDVVLYSFKNVSRDEDNILDQINKKQMCSDFYYILRSSSR